MLLTTSILSLLVLQVLGSFVGGLPADSLHRALPSRSLGPEMNPSPALIPLLKESDKPNVCPMALRAGGRKPGKPKEETKKKERKKEEYGGYPPLNPERKNPD